MMESGNGTPLVWARTAGACPDPPGAPSREQDDVKARAIAQAHLTAVRPRMAELGRLDRSASRHVRACSEQSLAGPAPDRTILIDLPHGMAAYSRGAGCCS